MVRLSESVGMFPGGLSVPSIRKRIEDGIDGVFLKGQFDGYRWWTCQEWVDDFLQELTEKKLKRDKEIPPTQKNLLYEMVEKG